MKRGSKNVNGVWLVKWPSGWPVSNSRRGSGRSVLVALLPFVAGLRWGHLSGSSIEELMT